MIIATAEMLSGLSDVGNGSDEDGNHVKDVALWPEIVLLCAMARNRIVIGSSDFRGDIGGGVRNRSEVPSVNRSRSSVLFEKCLIELAKP